MEQAQRLEFKRTVFLNAVSGLGSSLGIDLSNLEPLVADAVKNGSIQKFGYCSELCWKLIKAYIITVHGIETNSPKSAIKEFFNVGKVQEEGFEKLIAMIEDRNCLSHIYKESEFNRIYSLLPEYLEIMRKVDALILDSCCS
jgi:nucleotidyltransferase substrate binding protein (TIGR01987 family)